MPQFDITTYSSQIFWLILSFGILFLGLSRFIIPRFKAILLKRETLVDLDTIKTKNMHHQQQEQQKHRLDRLEKAQQKAHDLIKETVLEIDEFEKMQRQHIQDQINRHLKDFQASLEQEKKNLEKEEILLVHQSVNRLLPKLLAGEKR